MRPEITLRDQAFPNVRPMRLTRSPCCARATTGHAAALPSPAMNSRRRIGHASKPLCGQRIAVRVAWERVGSCRGADFLQPFFQRGRLLMARSASSLQRHNTAAIGGRADYQLNLALVHNAVLEAACRFVHGRPSHRGRW